MTGSNRFPHPSLLKPTFTLEIFTFFILLVSLTFSVFYFQHGHYFWVVPILFWAGFIVFRTLKTTNLTTQKSHILKRQREAIITCSADGIITLNGDGSILDYNAAARQIFGYADSEVINHKSADLFVPERFRHIGRWWIQNIASGGNLLASLLNRRLQVIGLRKDGSEFPAELTITLMPAEGPVKMTGFIRDLTGSEYLQRTKDTLHRRLMLQYNISKILLAAKTLHDGFAEVLELITRNKKWDLATIWLLDYENQKLKYFQFYQVPELPETQGLRAKQSRPDGDNWGFEIFTDEPLNFEWIPDIQEGSPKVLPKLDGAPWIRSAAAFPLFNSKILIGGFELFSSEPKVTPDGPTVELYQNIVWQLSQFAIRVSAEEALRHALAIRDAFISMASHELKTPLTSLSLQVQIAKRKFSGKAPGALQSEHSISLWDSLPKQISRLTHLVDDLLDASRIQAGTLHFAFEEVNLSEITKAMVKRFSLDFIDANCTVNLEIKDKVIGIFDPNRIEQIIDNFASNSIKYAPGSSITVGLHRESEFAVLTFKDQGPGFSPEITNRIFNRFERAPQSKTINGLGLGLFIVNEIVKGHRGRIKLESPESGGAHFTVCLPLAIPVQ